MSGQSNNWNPDDGIPDLSNRVILVTGGYSGLGLETVRQLAKHSPGRIYIAGRSPQKAHAALRSLKETGTDIEALQFLQMDLASFKSIKAAVGSFQRSSTRLDLLINNAGIMFTPSGLTEDGYEVQFGTNYMGHPLLTELLLPTLQATARLNPDVRVVNVSSGAEAFLGSKTYPLDEVKTTMNGRSTQTRYSFSKLAQIHYTAAAADRYPDVKFVSIHPGSVHTNLDNNMDVGICFLVFLRVWIFLFAVRVETGVLNQLWASVSPDAVSGEFYYPVGRLGKGSKASKDSALKEQLWAWTQRELERYL